jgi:SAM-dependent methyltransferase
VYRPCWCDCDSAIPYANVFVGDDERMLPLVRCEQCGVFCLYPAPSEAELLKYYDTEYYGAPSKKFVGPVAAVVSWFQDGRARQVAKYVPQGGRILDVGCGNGGFLRMMQRLHFKVEGTEWTETSSRRAAIGVDLTVHAGDFLTLDLSDRRYDAITLWHVFEHLREPFETLRRAHELLDDSGVLFLSMPNHESWQARIFGTSWFHLDPPRHLFGFGPRSIRTALHLAGFEVERCTTFSLEQNPFGFIQSVLNAAGFPRDRAYGVLKSTEVLPKRTKILDLFLTSVLAIPGFTLSSIASAFGAGATMTIVAKKVNPS